MLNNCMSAPIADMPTNVASTVTTKSEGANAVLVILLSHAAALISRAKSAYKIDDETDQQYQAKSSAAEGRPGEIKSTAAEQEEQNDNQYQKVHCAI